MPHAVDGSLPLGQLVTIRKAATVSLAQDATTTDAFLAVTGECLEHWQANVGGIDEAAPEALHQTRVGIRRFRSALSLFARAIGDPQVRWLSDEIRELALPLGDARDLDVLLMDEEVTAGLPATVIGALAARRREAYAVVRHSLSAPRWSDAWSLVERFRGHAPWEMPTDAPARVTASDALRRRWVRIRRDGADLHTLSATQRHQVRIQAKKLRYGAQFFTDLFPDPAGDSPLVWADALGVVQDRLGVLNDVHVRDGLLAAVGGPLERHDEDALVTAAQDSVDEVLALTPFWR